MKSKMAGSLAGFRDLVWRYCAANELPILLGDTVLANVSAIHRKAGHDLPLGGPQLVESEVSRNAGAARKCD